jgi:hypothetical protein
MPIEPHLFLSYGRPDKELALRISSALWRNRIECYNYLAKPIMEKYGTDTDHSKYLFSTRFFIAILSRDTLWRQLVMDEILNTSWFNQQELLQIPMVYITTQDVLDSGPYPTADHQHVIDPTRTGGVSEIVDELISLMGTELVARCQTAWETNRTLYSAAWQELDESLSVAKENVPLPTARSLMESEVKERWLEGALQEDLGKFRNDENKWIFLLSLAPILERAGLEMGRELRSLVPRLVLLGHQAPLVRAALASSVEPRTYREHEKIDDVGSVLIALRQIDKALNWMHCDAALDIAERFTWAPTRRLLLCGIYYCAAGLADDATQRKIRDDLKLSGVERGSGDADQRADG